MSQSPSIGRIVHCWPSKLDDSTAYNNGYTVAGMIVDVTSEMVDGLPVCEIQWFAGSLGSGDERMTETRGTSAEHRRGHWWWPPRT